MSTSFRLTPELQVTEKTETNKAKVQTVELTFKPQFIENDRTYGLNQQFSTGVLKQAHWCAAEFSKHAIPDDLVRGTDLCSLKIVK